MTLPVNLRVWWRYHPHGCPSWALQFGPLRLLWWGRDRPAWFVRRGHLHWLVGQFGKLEWLLWDRGVC